MGGTESHLIRSSACGIGGDWRSSINVYPSASATVAPDAAAAAAPQSAFSCAQDSALVGSIFDRRANAAIDRLISGRLASPRLE